LILQRVCLVGRRLGRWASRRLPRTRGRSREEAALRSGSYPARRR